MSEGRVIQKVELVWPGKDEGARPVQGDDGIWSLATPETARRVYSLVDIDRVGRPNRSVDSMVVSGDRLQALGLLRKHVGQAVRLAYLDPPRIEIDDAEAAFQGDSTAQYSTWLSVLRAHLEAVRPLLRRDGFIVLQVADAEEPFARLVADEVFARDNRVATIVWQRSYAPRNQRGMKEFTATHDCLLVYAWDKGFVDEVGLRQLPQGYSNRDDDPRGEWRAMHKGARTRRETTDYDTYVAPYRWQIVEGNLPSGVWRLNPLTGVIWGVAEELGDYPLTVAVSDSEGNTASASLVLHVDESGDDPDPQSIPWLFSPLETSGDLHVCTDALPPLMLGRSSSVVLSAGGGKPFVDAPRRPGRGRYWEYPDYTLLKAYLEDRVWTGTRGDSIPSIKSYVKDLDSDFETKNQVTWWPGRDKDGKAFAGYTQDATKHLKKLRELGLLEVVTTTAKPEPLLDRLVALFTEDGDLVLECFVSTGDAAAVALKRGRPFIHVHGDSQRERQLLQGCVLPRLRAVVEGKDIGLEEIESDTDVRADLYVPYDGGGGFVSASVGAWVLELPADNDIPFLNLELPGGREALMLALLTSEGYLPSEGSARAGVSIDGDRRCHVVPPDEYMTSETAAELASGLKAGERLTVYYFMASDDFDPSLGPAEISYRRVPMDLVV